MAAHRFLVIQLGPMVILLDALSSQLSEEQSALELPGVWDKNPFLSPSVRTSCLFKHTCMWMHTLCSQDAMSFLDGLRGLLLSCFKDVFYLYV